MSFVKSSKFGTQIGVSLFAMVALLVVLGTASLHAIRGEYQYVSQYQDRWAKRARICLRMQVTLQSIQAIASRLTQARDEEKGEALRNSFDSAVDEYRKEVEDYERYAAEAGDQEKIIWHDMYALSSLYLLANRQPPLRGDQSAQANADHPDVASLAYVGVIQSDASDIVKLILVDSREKLQDANALDERAQRAVGLILLIAISIAIFSAAALRRSLFIQLGADPRDLVERAKAISLGDFSGQIAFRSENPDSLAFSIATMRDKLASFITESRNAAARYQALYEKTPVMLFSVDSSGKILHVSDRWLQSTGYARSDVLGRPLEEFYLLKGGECAEVEIRQVFAGGEVGKVTRTVLCNDGSTIDVEVAAVVSSDANGASMSLSSWQDVTERNRIREALLAEHRRLKVTLDSIGDGVIAADRKGRIEYVNPAAEELTGWKSAEVQGKSISSVLNLSTKDGSYDGVRRGINSSRSFTGTEHRTLIHRTGEAKIVECMASAIPGSGDSGPIGTVFIVRDISETVRLHEELMYRATHDSLTGVLNRDEFEARVSHVVTGAQKATTLTYALMSIDLDQFKIVNDAGGHAAGDRVLKQVVQIVCGVIRSGDTFARVGGDEFGLLVCRDSTESVHSLATKICRGLDNYRFRVGDVYVHVGVSIGLVVLDGSWTSKEALLRAADSACYAAKASGRNRVHVYTPTDGVIESQRNDMQWARRLEAALDSDQFILYFQRIVPLKERTEQVHGEVLLRLRDTGDKLIGPGKFLPAAERFNLASKIDRWVVRSVFRILNDHADNCDKISTISINLSGNSISDPEFTEFLSQEIRIAKFKTGIICFEITETAVITNFYAASLFFSTMKKEGVRFALDDFGSGASSFGYLKALPIDYIKIDGQFVRELESDPDSQIAVKCINDVARVTGKKTVAEFVETKEVDDMLMDMGVDYSQGYLHHRPSPLDELFDID
ncbi:EAL domain-containing protein [Paraburkholderia tropica]|uniref:EAL domain-containing protein n=1 Tax=Paraburkholderia tropica TaxID=92647 RepID=UPI0030197E61